jgi:CBS domain-containing protein
MAQVREILAKKGEQVYSIGKNATILEAARVMNQHKIGALVVIEGGRVEGIFTERDVLRRVVGEQRNPATTKVAEVMTTDVACCQPDTPIEEAASVMKHHRIRHLPVVGPDRRLHGMISIGDINAHHADNQAVQIHFLNEYLYGRT